MKKQLSTINSTQGSGNFSSIMKELKAINDEVSRTGQMADRTFYPIIKM